MISRLRGYVRVALRACLVPLPQRLKRLAYNRVLGYDIAPDARIGLSYIDVDHLEMASGSHIGHGNLILRTKTIRLGERASVGMLNILRGGDRITLDAHATVMRFNVLNSIPDNDCEGVPDPVLDVGAGTVVVSGHRLDFTDAIRLGKNVIIAGRNSSLWTHNRQATAPIEIGDFCYVGSETRLAPGAKMGDLSILGLGAVLAGVLGSRVVAGGVPAKKIRDTNEDDERVLRRKTAPSIPDDLY